MGQPTTAAAHSFYALRALHRTMPPARQRPLRTLTRLPYHSPHPYPHPYTDSDAQAQPQLEPYPEP